MKWIDPETGLPLEQAERIKGTLRKLEEENKKLKEENEILRFKSLKLGWKMWV